MVEVAFLAVTLIGLLHGIEPGHGWPVAMLYATRSSRPYLKRLSQLFDNIPISSTILGCSCSRLHLSEILRWILSALRELCRRRSSFDISFEIPA